MNDLGNLVWHIVTGLFVNGDQSILWFDVDTGHIAYRADGDCCSKSWFADIIGVDWLKGHRVLRAENLEMSKYNVDDGRTRQDSDSAYGYELRTAIGWPTIIFRNSSNGYYGGSLEPYEGERPDDLTEITEHDWRA